jgi:hypothetical protein
MACLQLAIGLSACHSPGEYGYARVYAPFSDEQHAAAFARDYDAAALQRAPREWKGKPISVFGIVRTRSDGPNGAAYLTLSVRKPAKRNWCKNGDSDSCRVTVGQHELGVVHALVTLRSGDDIGKHSVQPDSLVRVIGVLGDNVDSADGMPILHASYYRHWPEGEYVTKSPEPAH